jgi:histidinol-phosphate aminotransferase
MALTRRGFLGSLGIGIGAVATGHLPALGRAPVHRQTQAPRLARVGARAKRSRADILLNSNENAYGQFASVQAAMRKAPAYANRYPFVVNDAFIERVAAYHHVRPEQVLLGNGSTEILRIAAETFCGPDKKLIVADPTFESIAQYAHVRGTPVVKVPLTADYTHNLEAMLAQADTTAGLVYVCNPNNPTSNITPRRQIDEFIRSVPANVHVLIDEAYHHFAAGPDYSSFLEPAVVDERVIVARTFSKVYGMAGLRLGYAVSAPATIDAMRKYQLFDNANAVALHAAMVALDDDPAMKAAVERITADRAEFVKQANARGVRVIPPRANFVMIETGRPVRQVIDYFQKNDVAIGRPFPPMETFARISLGTPQEMTRFWEVWDGLVKS